MARRSSTALVALIAFVVFPSMASAVSFHVGREADWNDPLFDYQAWAFHYDFHVGDSLVFSYDTPGHSVIVAGDRQRFGQCSTDGNLGVYETGYDELFFPEPGTYYFFCSVECDNYSRKKFAVTVT